MMVFVMYLCLVWLCLAAKTEAGPQLSTEDVILNAREILKTLQRLQEDNADLLAAMKDEEDHQTDEEGLSGRRQRAAYVVIDNGTEHTNNVAMGVNPDENTVESRIQDMQRYLQATGQDTMDNLVHAAAQAMAATGQPAPENFEAVNNVTKKTEGTIRPINIQDRAAFSGTYHTWERGIVPYVFDEAAPEDDEGRANIVAAMRYLESISCLQFPEWTPNTQAQYSLGHNARIQFGRYNGCWSYLGRITSDDAQKISACGSTSVALHEILHAMASTHEQSRSDRDQWIQIIWNNIHASTQRNFDKEETANIVPYDYSSVMQYSLKSFSNNEQQTMRVYDSDLRFLVGNRESFLSFSDISSINQEFQCKEQKCPDFSLQCSNHGFVGYVQRSCRCVCPDGLGGKTCQEIHVPSDIPTTWPAGSYTIPQSIDGCPASMASGTRLQSQKRTGYRKWSGVPHWPSGSYSLHTFNHHFCTSENSFNTNNDWPAGTYCIYRKGSTCPQGFTNGFIFYDDANGSTNTNTYSGTVPDGEYGDDTKFEYCCRNDAPTSNAMKLPTAQPFFLLPGFGSDQCQKVEGTSVTMENYYLTTEGQDVFQEPYPHHNSILYRYYLIIDNVYCYYQPVHYDCGQIIDLTNSVSSITISYPSGFGNYDNNMMCRWLIKSPENSIIKLELRDFDVVSNSDGTCEDFLEIRHHSITVPGARYCGQRFVRSMTTNDNYLMLVFKSSKTNVAKGFTAFASIVNDAEFAYSPHLRGITYSGTVAHTQHYKHCVRWDRVSHCPVNLFSDRTGMLGYHNYCRNPNGAEQPWCYVNTDCETDYCDVSGIDNCYDLETNCSGKVGSGYCDTEEGFERCHSSCGLCNQGIMPRIGRCSSTPVADNADMISTQKDEYSEGERVSYQCGPDVSFGIQQKMCLSDGSWSGTPKMCGGCPPGFTQALGSCYLVSTDRLKWVDARRVCQEMGADLVIITSSTEQNLLADMAGDSSMWIGLNDRTTEGTFLWQDGTPPSFTSWAPGGASKGYWYDCVVLDKRQNFDWTDEYCDGYWSNGYICEGRLGSACYDNRDDCSTLLSSSGDLCQSQPMFASSMCRRTCDLC